MKPVGRVRPTGRGGWCRRRRRHHGAHCRCRQSAGRHRLGRRGTEGGFFPFYIGLIIIASSAANLYNLFAAGKITASSRLGAKSARCCRWWYRRRSMSGLFPISEFTWRPRADRAFMMWLGKYRWSTAIPVALLVPVLVFVFFERWFLVLCPRTDRETAGVLIASERWRPVSGQLHAEATRWFTGCDSG